ncbi:Rv2334A family Cys-rich leader peptide [Mycobacterium tuberculosis]
MQQAIQLRFILPRRLAVGVCCCC